MEYLAHILCICGQGLEFRLYLDPAFENLYAASWISDAYLI